MIRRAALGVVMIAGLACSWTGAVVCYVRPPFLADYRYTIVVVDGTCAAGQPTESGWQTLSSSGVLNELEGHGNNPAGAPFEFNFGSGDGSFQCSATVPYDTCLVEPVHASCEATVDNSTTATGAVTFDFEDAGFTAVETLDVPPTPSLPAGCSGTFQLTGTLL